MTSRRPTGTRSTGRALPSGSVGPLPFALNSLIGREADIEAVSSRLMSPNIRLLTLIGPGGIGKSRLSLEVGHQMQTSFADGAQLIRLASVSDPELVQILLFRALGVRALNTSEPDWWTIRDRQTLLVIDNFEQVVAAAPILIDILSNCPLVRMLVTSRIPLNVSGEHEYRVPPLATTTAESDVHSNDGTRSAAVQLFVERAMAVRSDFALTAENAQSIVQLTRQLDGLPLAIELAAGQSRHLTPRAIEQRLAQSIDALDGGPLDRPRHQRALRDTIAWSYDLLDQDSQHSFRILSVFAGNVMPQAAAFVLGVNDEPPTLTGTDDDLRIDATTLSTFMRLSENSLLVRGEDSGAFPGYSMLMTIRGFGQQLLHDHQEWESARQRHAEWFYANALQAAVIRNVPTDITWLDWMDLEHDNLRQTLEWYQSNGSVTKFATLVHGLVKFWLIRSHVGEGARWLQLVLDMDDGTKIDTLLRARLLDSAGWMAVRQGRIDDFRSYAERSVEEARTTGDRRQIASSLRLLGEVEDRSTNYGIAEGHVGEAYRIYRKLGDLTGVADTLASLGGLALDSGDLDKAVSLFQKGMEAATAAEDVHLSARVSNALSVTRFTRGEFGMALACAEQSLIWYERVGDTRGKAVALDHIGRYSRALGDAERAWQSHKASLAKRQQFGEMRGLVVWLELVNELLVDCQAFEAAARVLGGTERMRERGELPLHHHELPERQALFAAIRRHLNSDDVARLEQLGAALSLRELIDFAWESAEQALSQPQTPPIEHTTRQSIHGLTTREMEIAVLLAQRRSDREIADQLFISPRTANAHITRVLKKLRIHSRRDVAQALAGGPDGG